MQITEVRIKLMEDPGERLKAFCSITFDDCFVVRDLKIIEGANGPFVAMPSRKLTAHCPQCGSKNHLRAAHCNQCGSKLRPVQLPKDEEGRARLYADIAHPINSACREMIQARVIAAFEEEKARARLPGYVPSYADFDGGDDYEEPLARPTTGGANTAPSAGRRSHVQPAEKPHGPHQPRRRRGGHNSDRPKTEFGAGIFD